MLGWDEVWGFACDLLIAAGIVAIFYFVVNFLVTG